MNETKLRGNRRTTSSVLRDATTRTVRGVRAASGRANSAARGVAGGSMRAVGGIGAESGALVRDAVVGIVEGTGQVVSVTTPAIRDIVAGGIRGGDPARYGNRTGRNVVAGAIVGAEAVGLDESEAVAAAVAGAVEGISELGGDLEETARVAVGGVVSGMAETGGDVASATQDAAEMLIAHAVDADRSVSEIADVATSALDAAMIETGRNTDLGSEVAVAAAVGAVEAAYRMNTPHGDRIRQAVLSHAAEQASSAAPGLRRQFAEIAEQLSTELPRGRAAWRGKAMFDALRRLYNTGGIDLAGSLAYFTILSLFPLIALTIMVVIMLGDPAGVRAQITSMLEHYFPASGNLIGEAVGGLLGGSITFGAIALIGMLIGANGLLKAANRAVNRVYGTELKNVIGATAAEMAVAILLALLFLLSLWITTLFYAALGFSDEILAYLGIASLFPYIFISALSTALPVALTATVFTFVYRHLPNASVEWRDAAFGSLVAVVLFEIAKHAFFWFINLATNRDAVYGPVSSVVVLLMWAYISGLIFLYGVALARTAMDLRPSAPLQDTV